MKNTHYPKDQAGFKKKKKIKLQGKKNAISEI